MSSDTLTKLAQTIRDRREAATSKSYTRQLLDAGPEHCAKKFGEEAVELVIAGVSSPATAVTSEAADVLYHLLVLLEARQVAFVDVLALLEGRMGTSGLDEKSARSSGRG